MMVQLDNIAIHAFNPIFTISLWFLGIYYIYWEKLYTISIVENLVFCKYLGEHQAFIILALKI